MHDELIITFPKLATLGGFELMRINPFRKQLEIIPCPENGYSVDYLKAVVHHSKIYIRPHNTASYTHLHASTYLFFHFIKWKVILHSKHNNVKFQYQYLFTGLKHLTSWVACHVSFQTVQWL